MQIDSLGLPKYGTQDLMDLVYKGKLDTLFKVYAEKNEETTQFNSAVKESGQGLLRVLHHLHPALLPKHLLPLQS